MKLVIGIDTGGTYTDAVIYDLDKKKLLAKCKSLTTKQNLEEGIGNALDSLPKELLKKASLLCLSTTLATNACVEGKGSRAKLILMGTNDSVMEWIAADKVYGLKPSDVLCVDNSCSFDGTVIDNPNWDEVIKQNEAWFSDAQALSAAEVYAMHNAGACEKYAKERLSEEYNVPFVCGYELAGDLNVMERGSTAWLNAKLLTTVNDFTAAVRHSLESRGLDIKTMIVRSDGSLMSEATALTYPVRTILSGPAASIVGGRALSGCENSLIIDMGGTTTDISIVKNGSPLTTSGIRIGEYRTQIPGVFIDTFGLGGDSRIVLKPGGIGLSARRVQPLCIAAKAYPQLKEELKLLEKSKADLFPRYEMLYLIGEPRSAKEYNTTELELIEKLGKHPIMLGSNEINPRSVNSERLENEGIVMRCGMTPTDFMHIKGDFTLHDREASLLGARYLLRALPGYKDNEDDMKRLSDDIYDMVSKKLYENLVRVLLTNEYPKSFSGELSAQTLALIAQSWDNPDFLNLNFTTSASLVGIGAPTHIFLPGVARALGCEYVIPEHAEVANAIGAVIADISATVRLEVARNSITPWLGTYCVYTRESKEFFKTRDEAVAFAEKTVVGYAVSEARAQGALGELTTQVNVESKNVYASDGAHVDFGAFVVAQASGSVE